MNSGKVYLVRLGQKERSITVRRLSDGAESGLRYGITVDNNDEVEVDAVRPVDDVLSLLYQGRNWEAGLVEIEDGYEVRLLVYAMSLKS